MLNKIILASKSKVRKEILDKHEILCEVKPSNIDGRQLMLQGNQLKKLLRQ